ncbi:MAG: DUF6088 family protein [Planctomycetota bacterium]
MGNDASSSQWRPVADRVRRRIRLGGERLWRFQDFGNLPSAAVAQALSRLARSGQIERLSKGVYYAFRQAAFGRSRPNPAAVRHLASRSRQFFPSGIGAANLLGFSAQNPNRSELATSGSSLPRKLVGRDALIHTRRPEGWSRLTQTDAALLDFMRRGGRTSDLSPGETIRRVIVRLMEKGCYGRLLKAANTEPPRVRALLGALGERMGRDRAKIARLKKSLNPLSRYDFGLFSGLPNARSWQAKGGA